MDEKRKLLQDNFEKVVEWIKKTFPRAIESSYEREIEVWSVHHVYYTSFLTIKNGEIYHHRGSHGWSDGDTIYDPIKRRYFEHGRDVTEHRNDTGIEDFLHTWQQQKPYVIGCLTPYEKMYEFEV